MSNSNNKVSIPKEIFENIFFKNGGQKTTSDRERLHKSLTGEYQFPLDEENPITEPNAEIEKGEYLFDSKGIRKAMGKTHEEGGTPVKLEDGTRILSDHLKVGNVLAKELTKNFGIKANATDTYAKVLDKFGKKIGLDKANEELEEYIAALDKQKVNIKEEETYNLNKEYLTKEINEYSKKKEPLEKQREQFFNYIFSKQEDGKKQESTSKMEFGGEFMELANKYGISPERAKELMNTLPKHQEGVNGTVNGKDPEWLQQSNPNANYRHKPVLENTLPYTAPEEAGNDIWKGENYKNVWKPWVETSLSDPAKAKVVDDYLTNYSGEYGPRVAYHLKGLTGQARIDKIKELATDAQPGPFHNAVLAALKAATPAPVAKKEVVTPQEPSPFAVSNLAKKYYNLGLPDQTPLAPSSMDMHVMGNRKYGFIEPNLISPEKQLQEMDRSRLAAETRSQDLPDYLRAAQGAALTANANEGTNKVIADVNKFNSQAKYSADVFNQGQRDKNVDVRFADAMDFERKTLMAKNNTEQDWRGFYNRLAENQSRNWDTVNKFNSYNALNPDVQFTGQGYEVNPLILTDNEKDYLAKMYGQTKTTKFGGRFKNKKFN